MSDEEDLSHEQCTTQDNDDEWIVPEPSINNNSLHWSEDGIFAVATRQTIYLVDPCRAGTEGLVGTVSLLSRDEKPLVSDFRAYDYADDSRLVEDLRFQIPASISAVAWSPSGLGTQVIFDGYFHEKYTLTRKFLSGFMSAHCLCERWFCHAPRGSTANGCGQLD